MKLYPLLTVALALASSLTVSAEKLVQALKVEKTDGQTDTYLFAEEPQLTFEGRTLVITTTDASTSYKLSEVTEFNFARISGIDDVAADEIRFVYVSPGKLDVVADNHDVIIRVADLQGRYIMPDVTRDGNIIHIDLTGFAQGVYIISVNNQSIKIKR